MNALLLLALVTFGYHPPRWLQNNVGEPDWMPAMHWIITPQDRLCMTDRRGAWFDVAATWDSIRALNVRVKVEP